MKNRNRSAARRPNVKVALHRGRPYLSVCCNGCEAMELRSCETIAPGVSVTCSRCGGRVYIDQLLFAQIRRMIQAEILKVRWQTDCEQYPRLWIP